MDIHQNHVSPYLYHSQSTSNADLAESWIASLDEDSTDILDNLEKFAWASEYPQTKMAAEQQIPSQSLYTTETQDQAIITSGQYYNSNQNSVVYSSSLNVNSEPSTASEPKMATSEGQAFNFNMADYTNFRYHMSQLQTQEPVVTQQPQSSGNQTTPSTQTINTHPSVPVPVRGPQPNHLISPLLAPPRPQIPSGLRNSNYLIHPIIARPSTQVQPEEQSTKSEIKEDSPKDEDLPESTSTSSSEESVSSSNAENSLQMQLNQLVQNTVSAPFFYHYQDMQLKTEKDDEETTPDSQSAHPAVHSTEFLLQDGHASDNQVSAQQPPSSQVSMPQSSTGPVPVSSNDQIPMPQASDGHVPVSQPNTSYVSTSQPPVSYPTSVPQTSHSHQMAYPQPTNSHVSLISQPISSQSSQSEFSDDDRCAVADVTSSEISSDDSGLHTSEVQQDSPVNFWEQHMAASRVHASGVAHPKPVRLSHGLPMFPPSSFPWANNGIHQHNLHPHHPPMPPAIHRQPEVKTEDATSSGQDQQNVQEQPQQQPIKTETQQSINSETLSYFLSDFPRSLDNLASLQTPIPTVRPSHQHLPQQMQETNSIPRPAHQHMPESHHAPQNHMSRLPQHLQEAHHHLNQKPNAPSCPTPEKLMSNTHGVNMFSNNAFLSPSFFTHHQGHHGIPQGHPPASSTPDTNTRPVSDIKVSDNDSAIDVNPSPTSSIGSRDSPELVHLHLQNEDSNSSADTSLMRSRCSSVNSICDSSISSTASNLSTGSANGSFTAPRNKRPNPEPELGGFKKKSRTTYTPGQLRALERVYMENPYPECDTIDKLARDIDIPEQRLRVWFQNKRARVRRQAKQNKQAPHPAVNPYNAQPLSGILSSAPAGYPFLPPNSMLAPGQPQQMMQRPYFPYPQAPGAMMQHPVQVSSASGMPQHPTPILPQQPSSLTPQQSQIQRLYSFIAHKQH